MRFLPAHGGDIAWASARFAIAESDWLDLSTGISPWSWPVEHWPQQVFRSLPPQSLDDLCRVAGRYYQCASDRLLPVPGSQYAISLIPKLLAPASVAIPELGYQEHAQAWLQAGHRVFYYRTFTELCGWVEAGKVGHVVLINPNNPSADCVESRHLIKLHEMLAAMTAQKGLMIVDEAFMDAEPQHSIVGVALNNVVTLRSFGKFFGLAGVRLGFVVDHSGHWIAQLKAQAGPWLISYPAIWVAQQALQDRVWIAQQRARIKASSVELVQLLDAYAAAQLWPGKWRNGGLFVTFIGAAEPLYPLFVGLAERGILVRYGQVNQHESWLRVGLCENWTRLKSALQDVAADGRR